MKFYAGVGSRETPRAVQNEMTAIAQRLRTLGFVLRSGGADGADTAFERGAGPDKRVYVPWIGFKGRHGENMVVVGRDPGLQATAAQCHPAWWKLSAAGRMLHTRNVAQVLGYSPEDAVNSSFVVCWTPGASGSGGTGQAIRIAQKYGVKVYDLASATQRADFYIERLS